MNQILVPMVSKYPVGVYLNALALLHAVQELGEHGSPRSGSIRVWASADRELESHHLAPALQTCPAGEEVLSKVAACLKHGGVAKWSA